MKTIDLLPGMAAALLTSLCLISCEKAPLSEESVLPSDDASFEVIDVNSYSASEFADRLGVEAPAETKCKALSYEIARLSYTSIGANGKPVTLSMKIAYPEGILTKYHDPDYVVLDNHPTICSDVEAPYYTDPIALAKAMDDALVVCPDYEGYGLTAANDHPYLCHELNARQSIDAALAALDYISAKKGISMEKKYYLQNCGYSQGGGIALAVHKYIENNLGAADKAKLNLKESLCGGGPYSPVVTFEKYKEWDELDYPTVAPMQIIGFMAGFPEIFADFELADFFTPEFYNSGVIEMIRSKSYTIDEINEFIVSEFGSSKCSDMFSPAMYDENSELCKAVTRCLEINDLTTGWAPVKKVTLFHSKKDNVVPKENSDVAYEALKSGNIKQEWALLSPDHLTTAILYYVEYMGLYLVNGLLGQL